MVLTHEGSRIVWRAETTKGCEKDIWGRELGFASVEGTAVTVGMAKANALGAVARLISDEQRTRADAAAEEIRKSEEFEKRLEALKEQ